MSAQSSPIVVLEVGRPIVQDVESMLGEPVAVISYQRPGGTSRDEGGDVR